jgi:tRNA dimethylallyltransferase
MEPIIEWRPDIDDLLGSADQPLIVILGPTASGKTAFSIEVAQYIRQTNAIHGWNDAEVINADSRQLYKYLNIGTAKITEEEKQGIVHHLFDVLEPNEDVSIADYKKMASEMIADCHARHVVPMLVGGSMLYISAVVDGLDPLPVAPAELRKRLEAEYDADDGWALYDKLMEIDPATGKNFAAQNKHYVVRAMELHEMTGRKPSELKKTIPPPYQILQFGMYWPREELTKRIDARTNILLTSGWIEEVEGLLDKGFTQADPAMKSHGYKEIMQWLSSEERSTDDLRMVIEAKTRQYAKRQVTWWNNDNRIHWINAYQL